MRLRKQIDIGWADLCHALWSAFFRFQNCDAQIQSLCDSGGRAEVFLSVKSALDQILCALNLPKGSEVLMSAVTVQGMIDVVRAHGLVPIPLDLDPETLFPSTAELSSSVTERSKVLVTAHLFGNVSDTQAVYTLARKLNLFVIEDMAQGFHGELRTTNLADITLYSFGSLKTATSLGGAIAVTNQDRLLESISRLNNQLPLQARHEYALRALKYLFIKLISYKPLVSLFFQLCALLGIDREILISNLVRSVDPNDLIKHLRHRPSPAMTAVLTRRLHRFDKQCFSHRIRVGETLRQKLSDHYQIPGNAVVVRGYWVFPIVCEDANSLILSLFQDRFDAFQRGSMVVVPPQVGHPNREPTIARQLLQQIVFLPFDSCLNSKDMSALTDAMRSHADRLVVSAVRT